MTKKERRYDKAKQATYDALTHRGFSYTEAAIIVKILGAPAKEQSPNPISKGKDKAIDVYV